MSLSADDVYQAVKAAESTFPLPAPYFTVDVGTFNVATGVFNGLNTDTEVDQEPVEHGPGQHPRNPAPRFIGSNRVSVSIDARFHRTITTEPAPHVPLAPVLVKFSVTNAATSWTVRVNGADTSVRAGRSSVLVDVWDAAAARWRISIGSRVRSDIVWFQRPHGPHPAALGAFTIPVLPLTIVYAPPVDSLGASSAKYSAAKTVGSTVDFGVTTDVSSTVPVQGSMFLTSLSLAKGTFEVDALALKATGNKVASDVFSQISAQIGEISSTEQTGVADGTESTMTLIQSTSDELRATVTSGGPGVGDVLYFYRDVRMIWSYVDGRLRLCPLSFTRTFLSATGLREHADAAGISAADATALLALDPFTGPEGQHTLAADRFTFLETWEYGFGVAFTHTVSTTRETNRRTTHREYTTESSGWDAGPLFKALGLGGSDTTTVTVTNAVGEKTSSTVTLEANLVSGPQDLFVVNIWYDNLFGTFAFESVPAGPTVKFKGTGTGAAEEVTLRAGGKMFRTVTGPDGRFRFRAPHIPSGDALLRVGGVTRSVTI